MSGRAQDSQSDPPADEDREVILSSTPIPSSDHPPPHPPSVRGLPEPTAVSLAFAARRRCSRTSWSAPSPAQASRCCKAVQQRRGGPPPALHRRRWRGWSMVEGGLRHRPPRSHGGRKQSWSRSLWAILSLLLPHTPPRPAFQQASRPTAPPSLGGICVQAPASSMPISVSSAATDQQLAHHLASDHYAQQSAYNQRYWSKMCVLQDGFGWRPLSPRAIPISVHDWHHPGRHDREARRALWLREGSPRLAAISAAPGVVTRSRWESSIACRCPLRCVVCCCCPSRDQSRHMHPG